MSKAKWSKRFFAAILAVMMIFTMVGCGDKGGKGENNKEQGGSKTDDTVVNLDGYEFTIASAFMKDEQDIETLMGSERTFAEAKKEVEEKYNCKIKMVGFWPSIENVRAKILGGDKIADVIHISGEQLLQSIRAGYVQPLDSIDGLDLEDPRWVQVATEMGSYDGVPYGMNFMRPSEVRTCMVYNREVLKANGVEEDLEELVKNGEWTFEKFEEIAKKCTKDTNADGKVDVWGCIPALQNEFGLSLINSNGGNLVSVEDGVAKESFNDPKVISALTYLSKWINEDKIIANIYGSESHYGWTTQDYGKYFANGECAFMFCESWLVNQYIKKLAGDLDYGMVPLPKGPDAEDYVSTAYNALTFAIPSTNKDVDKTVIVMNALAKAVAGENPEDDSAFDYDIESDYFQKGDTESVEMYKLILSKSYVDLGTGIPSLLSDFGSICIGDACYKSAGTPAAAVESVSGMFQSVIDSVYNNK